MSTCWKCGQATPEGVVECEDGCQPHAYRELMALNDAPPKLVKFADMAKEQRALCLTIQLMLDEKTGCSDAAKAAVQRFGELIGTAIVDSGLSEFLKTKS